MNEICFNKIEKYFSNHPTEKYSISLGPNKCVIVERKDQKKLQEKFVFVNRSQNLSNMWIYLHDNRKKLSYFNKFKPRNIFSEIEFSIYSFNDRELEDYFENYLNYYFKYQNIILDIERICHERWKTLEIREDYHRDYDYIENIVDNVRPNKIDIDNFPPAKRKSAEEYFEKIKKLIELYTSDNYRSAVIVHLTPQQHSSPIPIKFRILNVKKEVIFHLGFFGIYFFYTPDILKINIIDELEIYFLISYLLHYDLHNIFYTELQKDIISSILYSENML